MHSGTFSSVRRETPVMGDPSLIRLWFLSLYMSGEELIWEAATMIFWCDIASGEFAPARQWETSFPLLSLTRKIAHVVAGCITFSGAKLAGIVILQGHAQLPRNNPQNFNKIGCALAETKRVWFCSRLARFLALRIKFGLSWRMDFFGQALTDVSLTALALKAV